MFVMVISAALVYAGVLGYALMAGDAGGGSWTIAIVLSAFIAPALAVWLSAEVLNWLQPRRMFVRGAGVARRRRAVLGAAIGTVGLAIGMVLMALLDREVADAPLMAVGAAVPVLGVFVFLPSAKTGRCVRCQYDLSGMTAAAGGVCPECGTGVMGTG